MHKGHVVALFPLSMHKADLFGNGRKKLKSVRTPRNVSYFYSEESLETSVLYKSSVEFSLHLVYTNLPLTIHILQNFYYSKDNNSSNNKLWNMKIIKMKYAHRHWSR